MRSHEKVHAELVLVAARLVIVRRLFFCLFLILFPAISAKALDPNRLLTQYGHVAWRVLDGYLVSPTSIAQTADGYIWIGSRDGIVRFDGVKFTPWRPPEGSALPNTNVTALLGTPDGSLWIGTSGGLTRMKDGQLTNFPSEPGMSGIGAIVQDETGAIWITRYRVADKLGSLCTVKEENLRCYGKEDGVPIRYGQGMARDDVGNMWIGTWGLFRWNTQSSELFFEKELENVGGNGVVAVAAGRQGQVWAAIDATGPQLGVRYLSDGKWSSYVVPGFDGSMVRANVLYLDRNGSLWVGSENEGLYRIHNGVAQRYEMKDGLSGNTIGSIFEDKEGNLWVQTENGVDMFRDTAVLSFSLSEGLSAANIYTIIATNSGSVWIGNRGAVDVIQPGVGIPNVTDLKGLPGQDAESITEDRSGNVWLSVDGNVMKYAKGQFTTVRDRDGKVPGHVGTAWGMTADSNGNIWVGMFSNGKRRLLRIRDESIEEEIPLDDSGGTAESLVADRQGAIWIGSRRDKIARYANGQMEIVSLGDSNEVAIYHTRVDSDNALWVSAINGVYRWKDGDLSLLGERNGLPCSSVFATLEDDSGDLWLYAKCGLLRIPAADIAAWLTSSENKVSFRLFDTLDGALPASGAVSRQRAAKSNDGRLWFLNDRAVQMIDPARTFSNSIPPPVFIEGLVADRQVYPISEAVNLPPLRSELEISFTALSYSTPGKVSFRYRLEGRDDDWHDAGTRRQVLYNSLAPGQYRFRVIGQNGDGVWNETGATLAFTVAPTWYQTTAFRVFFVIMVAFTIWGLYRLRIRQVSRVMIARFDERLAERTRLARELHDTLLQTIQGSKMVADNALEQAGEPAQMQRALKQLSAWLGQATDEGRAALNLLRSSTTETNDLAKALRRATEECKLQDLNDVAFSVTGTTKEMHPIVRDEIYRIAYEAIRNACQHSGASRVEIELGYADNVSVRIRDNGVGIDPVIASNGKEGHFGLTGMRERAQRIGAKLKISSSPSSGTEVTLVVPGELLSRNSVDPGSDA